MSADRQALVLDCDGVVIWVGPSFAARLALSTERILGRRLWRLAESRDGGRFLETRWDAILAGTSWQGRLGFRRADGEVRVDEYGLSAVRGGAEVRHVLLSFASHDGRGLAPSDVDAAELWQLQSTLELIPEPVHCHRGGDGSCLFVNDAFARMGGYGREALLGTRLDEWPLWQEPAVAAEIWNAVARDGVVANVEVTLVPRGRVPIAALVSGHRVGIGGRDAVLFVVRDVTAQRDARAALERRIADLHEMQRLGGVAVWTWDAANDSVTIDAVAQDVLGARCASGAPSMEDWLSIVAESDRGILRSAVLRCAREGGVHEVDHRVQATDGRQRHFTTRLTAAEEGSPAARIVHGLSRDVSDRLRLEALVGEIARGLSVAQGPELFSALARSLAVSLSADLAFVGELRPGSVGRIRTLASWSDGRPGPAPEYGLPGTPCATAAESGMCVHLSGVQRLYPLDSRLRSVGAEAYVGVALRDAHGAALGVMAVLYRRALGEPQMARSLLQIFGARAAAELERMRAGAVLEARESRHRTYIEAAPIGIVLVDAESTFVDANAAALGMIGDEGDAILGLGLADLVPPEKRPAVRRHVTEALEQGRAVTELSVTQPAGDSVVWRVESVRVEEERVLAFLTDLTAHRSLEEQLRRAHKMEAIGRLAGGVAHDFNNLLTVIGGHSTLMARLYPDDEDVRGHVSEIERAVERGARLTHQLLAVSRRDAVEPRIVSLDSIVTELETMLTRLVREDVHIVTRLAACPGRILADEGQIEQVVMNLIVNARDAMPEGGTVTIATAMREVVEGAAGDPHSLVPGRYVELTVGDTGVGMSPDVLAHIYEPFFTTKERGTGTGLGLATVYGVVQQTQGTIAVESQPGRGTTVTVLFPEARARGATVSPSTRGRVSGTILVVEDDVELRRLVSAVLSGRGYRVVGAGSSDEALDALDGLSTTLDLLLADIVLPGESGVSLARRMLVLRPGIRVLFMSGHPEKAEPALADLDPRGIPAGFLAKPFATADLVARIDEMLGRHAG